MNSSSNDAGVEPELEEFKDSSDHKEYGKSEGKSERQQQQETLEERRKNFLKWKDVRSSNYNHFRFFFGL